MAIQMPIDTGKLLGGDAARCDSVSLFMDRFADPAARENEKRKWFNNLIAKKPEVYGNRIEWIHGLPAQNSALLYAQLQSRLMVNMAGGVMENAGLCIDRFGLPCIPGSAVKGCARRAALAAFREWCETGQKPGGTETDEDNLFKCACDAYSDGGEMLAAIARVFGWCEQDWKSGSDFVWACSDTRASVMRAAAERLSQTFRWHISPEHQEEPWRPLPNFAGSVSFLPAHPLDLGRTGKVEGLNVDVPPPGKLELDVVTVHHREYYASDNPNAVATDTEEPVPNIFPAVAAGHVFSFIVTRLRDCSEADLKAARAFLSCGLSTFGLGAKTNAGYGWFDAGQTLQDAVRRILGENERKRAEELARQQETARLKAEEESRRRLAEERKAKTEGMTAEQEADYDLSELTPDQFRGRLDNFAKRDKAEQEAIVRALRLDPSNSGSRRKFWDDLKSKAVKGGKPAQIEQAIRQLSKQMFPGKEGKMP